MFMKARFSSSFISILNVFLESVVKQEQLKLFQLMVLMSMGNGINGLHGATAVKLVMVHANVTDCVQHRCRNVEEKLVKNWLKHY